MDEPEEPGRARTAYSGAATYTFALMVEAAISFALVILLTRGLSVADFTRYALFKVALAIGAQISNVNGIAAMRTLVGEPEQGRREIVVATLMVSQLVIALTIAGVTSSVALLVPGEWLMPLLATALTFVLQNLGATASDALRGLNRHRVVVMVTILDSVVWAGLMVLALSTGAGLVGLILAQAGSASLHLVICLIALGGASWRRPSSAVFLELFRFGRNTTAYSALRALGNCDRYVVDHGKPGLGAGLYQVATVPLAALELLETAAVWAFEPYLYGVSDGRRSAEIGMVFRVMAAVLIGCSTVLAFGGAELLAIVAPPEYQDALVLVPLLLSAAVARSLTRVIATTAGFSGETRIWMIAAATELLVGLGLILPAMALWGLAGAGVAKLLGAVAGMYVCYYLSRATWSFVLPIHRANVINLALCACAILYATPAVGQLWPLHLRGATAVVVVGISVTLLLGWRKAQPFSADQHRLGEHV